MEEDKREAISKDEWLVGSRRNNRMRRFQTKE
jgi:hypothetical protein